MKKTKNRNIAIFIGINIILSIIFWSVLTSNAQYPFYNPFYGPANPYLAALSYMPFGYSPPFCYSPPIFNAYNNYYPYTFSMLNTLPMLNALPMSLPLSMGFPAPFMPPVPITRIAMQATGALPLTSTGAIPLTSTSTTIIAPAPTDTTLSVLIASLLINTGNPQVSAVLALIANDPTLLDNPFLLDALINTGNSQVALVLSLLAGGII